MYRKAAAHSTPQPRSTPHACGGSLGSHLDAAAPAPLSRQQPTRFRPAVSPRFSYDTRARSPQPQRTPFRRRGTPARPRSPLPAAARAPCNPPAGLGIANGATGQDPPPRSSPRFGTARVRGTPRSPMTLRVCSFTLRTHRCQANQEISYSAPLRWRLRVHTGRSYVTLPTSPKGVASGTVSARPGNKPAGPGSVRAAEATGRPGPRGGAQPGKQRPGPEKRARRSRSGQPRPRKQRASRETGGHPEKRTGEPGNGCAARETHGPDREAVRSPGSNGPNRETGAQPEKRTAQTEKTAGQPRNGRAP